MVTHLVVYYTEVYVGQELSSYIRHFFVLLVVLHCIVIEFLILLAHFHVVNSDAIVS